MREIASRVSGPVIAALARTATGDIERAAEALKGAYCWRIHTFICTCDVQRESMLKMSYEQVLEVIRENVTLAKSYTDDVEFSAQDATAHRAPRSWPAWSRPPSRAAATTINVPDTVGFMRCPQQYGALLRYLIAPACPAPGSVGAESVHCHNDLGVWPRPTRWPIREAGAAPGRGLRSTAFGERAGNAALEEVVMAHADTPPGSLRRGPRRASTPARSPGKSAPGQPDARGLTPCSPSKADRSAPNAFSPRARASTSTAS